MDRTSFVRGLLSPSEAYGSAESQPARMNPAIARRSEIAARLMSPPTSVMDERYPAWKKSQDQAEQFLLAADFVSSAIPAAVMAAPYAKKGLLAAGKTLAPKVENYMARTGLLQPATVWHGSPHRFDKFDASKIGTGEGAQAYGHGLYFAESPDVAKSYRTALAPDKRAADLNTRMKSLYIGDRPATEFNIDMNADLIDAARKGPSAALAKIDESLARWSELAADKTYPFKDYAAEKVAGYTALRKEAAQKGVSYAGDGALYKVDLPDEAIAKMLDWDKPLSQQAPEVQKALLALNDPVINAWKQNGAWEHAQSGGASAYKHLSKGITKSSTESGRTATASDLLRSQGVPGIRYLDGGSRGTGAGTSNYVVFPGNESLLKILSRE